MTGHLFAKQNGPAEQKLKMSVAFQTPRVGEVQRVPEQAGRMAPSDVRGGRTRVGEAEDQR